MIKGDLALKKLRLPKKTGVKIAEYLADKAFK